jgi:hypothetical protein
MAGGRRHSDGPTGWKARTRKGQTVVDVSNGGRFECRRFARGIAQREELAREPLADALAVAGPEPLLRGADRQVKPGVGPAHIQHHVKRPCKIQVHAGKCDFAALKRRRRPTGRLDSISIEIETPQQFAAKVIVDELELKRDS